MNKEIQEIAEYYGLISQMGVLQEECSELIKAASKYLRYGTDEKKNDIAEEIGFRRSAFHTELPGITA